MIHFLIGGAKKSGAEKRMLRTAIEVAKHHKVKITMRTSLSKQFSLCEKDDHVEYELLKDVIFGYRSNFIFFVSLFLFNMKSIISKSYFHVALFKPYCFPFIFFKKNVLFEVTSPDVARSSILNYIGKYHPNTKLVCVSSSVEKLAKKNAPQLEMITRALPFSEFSGGSNCSLDLDGKANRVIFAHRLISRKNPELCVDSFLNLSVKYPEWEFCIFGDGPLSGIVSDKCLGVDNVNFYGRCNDMPQILKNSKIFISLIEPDNYPSQSILEAIGLGNALVVSNTGESKYKFINNNGHAVELNMNEVTEKLSMMLDLDQVDIKKLQLSSIELSKKYSLEKYVNESLLMYR